MLMKTLFMLFFLLLALTSDIVTSVACHDNLLALGTERGQLLIKDTRNTDRPLKTINNHCRSIRRIKFNPHKFVVLTLYHNLSLLWLCCRKS